MGLIDKVTSLLPGQGERGEPAGVVHVVDPSPLNWLWITYNTIEELVRVAPDGRVEPAAMEKHDWADDRTLDIDIREGNRFQDGTPLTAADVKRSFDERQRWAAPDPPGTQFNFAQGSTCEVTGERSVRLRFPQPDGGALAKLRAMHLGSTRFWDEIGFGYARTGTGEGHW